MKICWDTLEQLRYNKKTGGWHKNKNKFLFKENCQVCGEDFLTRSCNIGLYCSSKCSSIGNYKQCNFEIRHQQGEKHPNWKGGIKQKGLVIYDTYAPQINWCEQTRRDPENYDWLQVKCTYCGKWYSPKGSSVIHRIEALNGNRAGESRLYCSNECKRLCPTYGKVKYSAEEEGAKQLSREVQPALRQMVFERDNWTCVKCGSTEGLQCHHREGILWEPLMSADMSMCLTYCVPCHMKAHKIEGCSYYDMRCK